MKLVTPQAQLKHLGAEVQKFSSLVWHRWLVEAAGGNVSARVPGASELVITATGFTLREITDEAVMTVDLDGRVLAGRDGLKPSEEMGMHLAVYRRHPEAGAAIHCHPPYVIAVSSLGKPLPMPTVTALGLLKFVPTVPPALSGSKKLHEPVELALRDYPQAPGVILQYHGIIAFGRDLQEAFNRADLIEKTARVWYLMQGIGGPLPDPTAIAHD